MGPKSERWIVNGQLSETVPARLQSSMSFFGTMQSFNHAGMTFAGNYYDEAELFEVDVLFVEDCGFCFIFPDMLPKGRGGGDTETRGSS
jgi:hypothetical protein